MKPRLDIREQIVGLHLKGLSYAQIRNATGLSRGTIGGHLMRWRRDDGIGPAKVNERPWTSGEERDLVEMYDSGAAIESIAVKLDRSPIAIDKRVSLMRAEERMIRKRHCDHYSIEKQEAARQRADDARFVHALALAFQRGDHLPAMARAA